MIVEIFTTLTRLTAGVTTKSLNKIEQISFEKCGNIQYFQYELLNYEQDLIYLIIFKGFHKRETQEIDTRNHYIERQTSLKWLTVVKMTRKDNIWQEI